MIFGREDPHVPLKGRMLIKEVEVDLRQGIKNTKVLAMEKSGVLMEWVEVNGDHAFIRDEFSKERFFLINCR